MKNLLGKVLLLSVFLMMPAFANAQTYWQITTDITPPGIAAALPVTTTPGTSLAPTGKAVYVTNSTTTSVDFTVPTDPLPAGYTLTSVTVDGTRVRALDGNGLPAVDSNGNYLYRTTGTFTINKGGQLTHSITANYTPYISNTFTVKSIAAPGGWISPSQTVAKNGSATFTIAANPGSTLIGILVDGVSTGTVSGSYTISNVTGNHTIQPVFDAVKSLSAVISIPPALSVTPGKKILVVGNTKPAFASGVTFNWSATNGAIVGAQVVSNGVSTVEITAPATGTFSVGLDVAVVGQPVAAPVTSTITVTPLVNSCMGCHNGVGGPDSLAYVGSTHDTTSVTCQNCHNPNNDLSHAYKPVAQITCSTTSCHTSFNHNGKVASDACLTCHNKHSLQVAAGGASCDFCHGNPPATKTLGVSTYTHTSSTCSDCHSVPPTTAATATHRDGTIEILTNAIACSSCHSYPPSSHVTYNAVGGTSPNCSTCHTYTGFNGATHNNGIAEPVTSCSACHGNPPQVLTVDKSGHTGQHLNLTDCAMCHGVGAGTDGSHKNGTVNVLKSGAPHFNNITSGMYPAAYVTMQSTCADCHNNNSNNLTIRQQWAASGHANTTALPWIDYDFKNRTDGCVRCHTTTGFIAYSTAKIIKAWGTASDKTKEVLTCVGCHKDVANGVVRTVTPNKPFADEQAFTNQDVGVSNICMDCHSGRNNGASIQAKVTAGADFSNLSYIAPHYLTAAGSLQGKSGYDFPGRTYSKFSDNAHGKVGTLNSNSTGTDGPCVACHMSASAKHTFSPVTEANGVITAITATTCANCHTDSSKFNAAAVDARKVAFVNALTVLKEVLASKSIVVTDNYPYVANKNWGTGQAGANVMGAAFNYKLFATEPGAYTHNPEYAKQLIVDSIEAVVTPGNTVTGSDISSYLTAGQNSALALFNNSTSSCASCHSFPPATSSHASATTSPLNCSNCHIYTGMGSATHNNGTVDFGAMSCTSCHGNPPAVLTTSISGHTGTHTAATDCVTCHGANPGASGHNNGTLATTCVACHGNPPTVLTVALSGHTGTHTAATDCATCHGANPGASGHNNGTLATTCVACHGNPPTTQTIHTTGAVKYTHSTQNVVYTNCTGCHDSTHKNGTVDIVTNANACSSCHSYPPASGAHASALGGTSPNCSTCHPYTVYSASTHNNGTLNFETLTCDTCHGYPPMSAAQLSARANGTYVNARVEDYSGGGGHHNTHLLPTVTAAEGFTPCLPCHPSAYHSLGGSVVKANVNIFGVADTDFRFDETREKRYNVATLSCSNVSCHFQPTAAW